MQHIPRTTPTHSTTAATAGITKPDESVPSTGFSRACGVKARVCRLEVVQQAPLHLATAATHYTGAHHTLKGARGGEQVITTHSQAMLYWRPAAERRRHRPSVLSAWRAAPASPHPGRRSGPVAPRPAALQAGTASRDCHSPEHCAPPRALASPALRTTQPCPARRAPRL
ncbi:hypothetical protein O3P69_010848 [Scylla paramamosain]|uniref:Uncharacterized protein n=1 Tax=Scylla paramamosain TaxID=85552 RepID=A0AAW0TFX3_SCYPA